MWIFDCLLKTTKDSCLDPQVCSITWAWVQKRSLMHGSWVLDKRSRKVKQDALFRRWIVFDIRHRGVYFSFFGFVGVNLHYLSFVLSMGFDEEQKSLFSYKHQLQATTFPQTITLTPTFTLGMVFLLLKALLFAKHNKTLVP